MAKDSNEAAKQRIREQVSRDFAKDNVSPDEVVLKDNGEIVIDRRKKKPWAKPFAVGTWS
ncbi:hypothetical protein [Microbispora triticiradicis]|uniref:hypothetical protein n=1 Tax=Microbispora triticiradicis TaxID=2200763 RepID=UPI001AD70DEC|nr:hypothetical protein [Microbispora triticiradicis]MBO4275165.1 hypothetical protein [Microbispora triticiradicis]